MELLRDILTFELVGCFELVENRRLSSGCDSEDGTESDTDERKFPSRDECPGDSHRQHRYEYGELTDHGSDKNPGVVGILDDDVGERRGRILGSIEESLVLLENERERSTSKRSDPSLSASFEEVKLEESTGSVDGSDDEDEDRRLRDERS